MILFQNQIINRSEASIDIEDRGYQFGDGVYEVIRVYDGNPFLFKAHYERLHRSASEIFITLPYSYKELEEKITQLIQVNRLRNGHIYMQVTRGVSPRNHSFPVDSPPVFVAYTKEYPGGPKELQTANAMVMDDIRWLRCDIKSLNLLASVLAKQQAVSRGYEEAILHRDGLVTEGSSTNVFIVNNHVLHTHPANHLILNGITRQVVIELADQLGYSVQEEAFTVTQLKSAEEVFITASTFEIKAIVKVDETVISNGLPGNVTKQLFAAFQQKIKTVMK